MVDSLETNTEQEQKNPINEVRYLIKMANEMEEEMKVNRKRRKNRNTTKR